ncbi:unnamed protein product [Schistosoma rodhaini]|uniref:Uncharacterized protein n=1 Tax=Schistosoma rodhaini TaxID=6188 RepID=A0AA85FP74_9TREM|nr:unnamed protein product [Schistosoma rodhaini]
MYASSLFTDHVAQANESLHLFQRFSIYCDLIDAPNVVFKNLAFSLVYVEVYCCISCLHLYSLLCMRCKLGYMKNPNHVTASKRCIVFLTSSEAWMSSLFSNYGVPQTIFKVIRNSNDRLYFQFVNRKHHIDSSPLKTGIKPGSSLHLLLFPTTVNWTCLNEHSKDRKSVMFESTDHLISFLTTSHELSSNVKTSTIKTHSSCYLK